MSTKTFAFPQWVHKGSIAKQKSARLRYLIRRLALEHVPSGSVRALCESTGISNHSTVSLYISRGEFTHDLAQQFEATFKLPAAWLTDPITIPAAKSAK